MIMLDPRWNRLLHYLRKGLDAAGLERTGLRADPTSGSVWIAIPGTEQWWGCVVAESDVRHGDLVLEAEHLLVTYRIACAKAGSGASVAARTPVAP